MAANTAPTTKFTLRTFDGKEFKVDEAVVAKQSRTIKNFIDNPNFGLSKPMYLPFNITGKILSKVIEYCEKHVGASSAAAATTSAAAATNAAASSGGGGVDELKEWDEQFVNAMDKVTLFGLVFAANFLGISSLFKLVDTAWTTKVTLRSSDGEEFMVDEAVAKHSPTIKKFIDQPNFAKSNPIPLLITGKILSKVIEYSKKHVGASASNATTSTAAATATTSAAAATATTSAAAATNAAASSAGSGGDDLKEWDEEFVKAMDTDRKTLLGLALAADYLGIRSLFDLASSALADVHDSHARIAHTS